MNEGDINIGLWWYAISKLSDEAYFKCVLHELPGSKLLMIRPFNVIAPVQTDAVGFVFPRFFKAALSGEPLLVYGDGSQRRSFTWGQDFVDCLIALVEKEAWGKTVNIGGTESLTIVELAEKIIAATKSSSEIKFIDPQEIFSGQFDEIPQRVPDVNLLRSIIGKAPETTIDTMITSFNNFYINTNQNHGHTRY